MPADLDEIVHVLALQDNAGLQRGRLMLIITTDENCLMVTHLILVSSSAQVVIVARDQDVTT